LRKTDLCKIKGILMADGIPKSMKRFCTLSQEALSVHQNGNPGFGILGNIRNFKVKVRKL
jgi:hypothetical protein